MHNEYLEVILSDYNYEKTHILGEFEDCFFRAEIEDLNYNDKINIWNKFVDTSTNEVNLIDIDDFLYSIDTTSIIIHKQLVKNIVIDSKEIIENWEAFTYSNFEQQIDELINSVLSNNLSSNEKLILLSYLKVAKKSAYFWMSTDNGGNGIGYKFLTNNYTKMSPLGSALVGDCGSLGIGMIAIAIGGAISGVGTPALIICAGEAAASSGLLAAVSAVGGK